MMRFTLFLMVAGAFFSGCALSPGLYTDRMDIKIPPTPADETERMGEDYRITPITAKTLVEILREKGLKDQAAIDRSPVPDPSVENYNYKIGPYDVLSITVWEHPELNLPHSGLSDIQMPGMPGQQARASGHVVDGEGNIFFPHVGVVQVAGLTISQARKMLTEKLARYIPNPQLDLSIADYRSKKAYILGEVNTPGALPLGDKPVRLLEAVALKGGITGKADPRSVILIRDGKSYPVDFEQLQEGDLSRNHLLQDGDILTFGDNRLNRVFVIGELRAKVHRTIPIPRGRGLNLADAITSSGGFDLASVDPAKIFVFRFDASEYADETFGLLKPKIFHLDASSAEAMLLAAWFPMQPLDVVYVGAKDIVRWNRFVLQILPTLKAIWYPTRTVRNWDALIDDRALE